MTRGCRESRVADQRRPESRDPMRIPRTSHAPESQGAAHRVANGVRAQRSKQRACAAHDISR
ncbi:MAG TPA: hypothetical protein VFF43_00845, partial [Caldimonas sp.]|nr:hypothetical protein [Caldimonas sp.]